MARALKIYAPRELLKSKVENLKTKGQKRSHLISEGFIGAVDFWGEPLAGHTAKLG